jgi:DNA-binding transcriptional regulator YiaG
MSMPTHKSKQLRERSRIISDAPPRPTTAHKRDGSITADSIRKIRERLSLSMESLGKMLQVSSKTIGRWEETNHGPKSPNQILSVHKLKEIVDLGCQIYTEEGLHEFLFEPQHVFNGHTAYQLISIGEYDAVISALVADYEGSGF